MTDLSKLLEIIGNTPEYRRLLEGLRSGSDAAVSALEGAKPYLLAALYTGLRRPVLVVTAQPENARKLHEQLFSWCPSGNIRLFPEPDSLPYERLATDAATEMERLRVLSALAGWDDGGADAPLVIASAAAVMSRTPRRGDFISAGRTVALGTETDPFQLLERWEGIGYQAESTVELPGTMSHRGGIIDVFPPTSELPVRLEFFGNTVDSLRYFDPATQRSVGKIDSIFVGPATELLAPRLMDRHELEGVFNGLDLRNCAAEVRQQFQRDFEALLEGRRPREVQFYAALFNRGCLADYLPDDTRLVLDQESSIERTMADLDAEAGQLRAEKMERGELPANFPRPYFTGGEVAAGFRARPSLRLEAWGVEERLDFISAPGYAGQLPAFLKKVLELREQGKRLVIVSHQASRLSELLEGEDVIAAPVETVTHAPGPGELVLVAGSLPEGWVMGGDTYLFTDAEIFGFVKQRRLVKRRPAAHHKLMVDIIPDDYVVHVEHGIGLFKGVTTLSAAGSEKEYLVLQYAAGDTLYVPTDQIDRVSRYVGAGDRTPVLSRLGTMEWVRTKQRAKEAAEVLAQELLALYASREVVAGFAFSRDTVWQQELEAAFPYVETPDQLEAQREVKEDMQQPRPMDRLVCGDVGYGKTEVAIRAAFKAVMDGKQVAVLVPTTVLAQQHYATFAERLEAFPVRAEVLSRFRSTAEQREVIDGLAGGTVDICIGTHRLLQKDVAFKNLGLLIVDEEQRFGVNHKEHLKKMRQEVDVLTLSATPIPRTLHMSLAGVRDMSTMETPPEERLPVKTYVAEYNDHLVREAILRELERNGQVFFVHNRVQSIAMVAASLRELVPEASVAIAHGQMPEEELEKVMTDFTGGRVDILVCTTIIESGLDMPNANTLIVNRADKFGLTQLYQLRGRVGRGANLAYAYLLYDGGRNLTPVAHKRLRTIYEATELGAGFSIAMKDLEIRGAGTLLGPRQSGHITAIGFNLYTRLLAEAVEEQKAVKAGRPRPMSRLPAPSVDLPLDAFIPEDYVPDVETRLELYRELGASDAAARLDDIAKEYADRFGAPPVEVENLFYAVRIKGLAAKAGIESIITEDGQIILRRFRGLPFDALKIGAGFRDGIEVGRTQIRISHKKLGRGWKGVLEGVVNRLLT
ncbi:MAG TPA: transcription-repair coupling factor [Dehalococcoidales bacterium]|nr:transcription-repair coupling factor [Dehalococcoidales bacterium]